MGHSTRTKSSCTTTAANNAAGSGNIQYASLNSEMVLFLPKGSRSYPRKTYQTCLVTRKYATMTQAYSAGTSEYDVDIFASAAPENSSLMYTKSLFVHGRLPETVSQHSPAEYTQDALHVHRGSSCSVIFCRIFLLSEQVQRNQIHLDSAIQSFQ